MMYHRTPLADDVASAANVRANKADLNDPATLPEAVASADVIVHFSGRLLGVCAGERVVRLCDPSTA